MRCRRLLPRIVCALIGGMACVSVRPPTFFQSAPARDWGATLATARADAAAGRFPSADSVLASFDGNYAGSPQAIETRYWRAVFDLDPANTGASAGAALSLLDAYIADSRARAHVDEAHTLRGVAVEMDSLRRYTAAIGDALQSTSSANATSQARVSESRGEVTTASAKAETEADEIRRLKDELAKANEELDRIKKRLAAPGKPPA